MEAKEKAIMEAYGEHWNENKQNIDFEGWFNCGLCCNGFDDAKEVVAEFLPTLSDYQYINTSEYGDGFGCIRPKSLSGIETNNGWIRIESEADLPKETIACWFYDKIEDSVVCGNYNADFKKFNWSAFIVEWSEQITHYQPIIKPLKPIY